MVPATIALLWFLFFIVSVVSAAYVFGILYHWVRYAYMYPLVWAVFPFYIIGTLVFFGAAFSSLATL